MGKRKSRRQSEDGGLNITSMMDMMTIILVFLLKSYATDDVSVAPSSDLEVPVSTSVKPTKLAVSVVVSKKEIVVDGQPVLSLTTAENQNGVAQVALPEGAKEGQSMINDLFAVLEEKAKEAKAAAERSQREDLAFKGEILLQCDKTLPFDVIRDVMYTAGQAQFGNFRFVVIKGSG